MATITPRKGKQGITYRVEVRRSGYPTQVKTFQTEQQAQDWAYDLERDIRDRRVNPESIGHRKTLGDAIDKYLAKKIKGTKNAKDTTRLLGWWNTKLGTAALSDLTANSIDQCLDKLDCAGSTQNRHLGALSGCLTYIGKAPFEWIQVNPCRAVPRREEGKRRERIITKVEWKKLVAHADKQAKTSSWRKQQIPTYLRLAYETGRRRSELLKLRWVDVDFDEGLLYLLDTKTGDDQISPISDKMVKILQAHEREHRVDGWQYVFRGRFPNKPTDFDDVIREMMRELFEPDRKGEMPVFHSIRHTVATELGDGGATEAQIMAVTGHSSSASVNRYVKKTEAAARAAQAKRSNH